MSKEKVIEIKIKEVTYIVSEVNRNYDHLKETIKDILIEILKYEKNIVKIMDMKYMIIILMMAIQDLIIIDLIFKECYKILKMER